MSDATSDAKLLREFSQTGSAAAWAELSRRYTDMVYSAARRQTRDSHLAEDITQAVFILLSQRAHKIRGNTNLIGWLHQTTRYTAANALKIQRRRQFHERAHAAQEPIMTSPRGPERWTELAPMIDQAVGRLDKTSRTAVLLRYFQNKTVQEVASETGVSVDAAQKRLSRAIQKLRTVLTASGFVVSAVAITSLLAEKSVEAAPNSLHPSIAEITAGSNRGASPLAREIATRTKSWLLLRQFQTVATLCAAIGLCALPLLLLQSPTAPADAPPLSGTTVAGSGIPAAVSVWNSSVGDSIPKPWPLALPGAICGSPMPADLFGDGKKEIVVNCMQVDRTLMGHKNEALLHPHPTLAALVCAYYLDGTPVPGFPVQVVSEEQRRESQKLNPKYSEHWGSTLSLVKINGKDVIVTPGPNFKTLQDRYVLVIKGDGSLQKISVGGWRPDPWTTIAVADIHGNGHIDLLGGYAELVDGVIRPSKFMSSFPSAFGACVGDANGDGRMKFFWAGYGAGTSVTGNGMMHGYDQDGHALEGWPQAYGGQTGETAVMGDLLGDGKMEVVMSDEKNHLLAWTWDGQPFGNTFPESPAEEKKLRAKTANPNQEIPDKELCTSIFKDNITNYGPVSLADLDGDGKAEVIIR
jgi:RNA polymerase sigma factor (sigma-70 family)